MRTTSTSQQREDRASTSYVLDGKYVVDGLCRQSGPAALLQARRLPAGPRVMIAVLRPEWARYHTLVDRFLRDGEAAMRVRGEHALRVLDEGVVEGALPYLVFEHAEGPSLEQLVSTRGSLRVPMAVDWLLQASEAVAQAHSYGVVHGDLKPATMFLTHGRDGRACVKVSFGQRRVTVVPPSRPCGVDSSGDLDVRPDIEALGSVLEVLLTGGPATGNDNGRRRMPRALEEAMRGREDLGPAPRYASVAELARALAPFGTPAARVSCERIECLLEDRVRVLTRPKLSREVWPPPPGDPLLPQPLPYSMPASGNVVLLGLAMLALLGAGAFGALYMSIPRGQSDSDGAAEMQPTTAAPDPPPTSPRRSSR
jgi:serine/threonine-protein kinase